MPNPYASIAAILLAVSVLIPSNALINTLVPLRGKLEGFSSVSLGFMGSVYFAAMLLGALASPAIIKRLGYAGSYIVCAVISAVVAILYPLTLDPVWWTVLRAIVGFGTAVLYGVIDGWVQGKADNENRGSLGAVYQIVHFIGSTIGQSLIVTADPRTFTLFALGSILAAFSILPFVLPRAAPPAKPLTVRPELGWLMATAPVAAAASLSVGVANGSLWSLFPVFGVTTGLSTGQISAFLSATVAGSASSVWFLGRLSDRMDRRVVMAAQMVAAAVCEAAMWLFASSLGSGIVILGFMIGCVSMTIYPIAISHANDRATPDKAVAVGSGILFFYCAGAIIGPMASVALMERISPSSLFLSMALAHAAALVLTILRINQRAPAPVLKDADPTVPP